MDGGAVRRDTGGASSPSGRRREREREQMRNLLLDTARGIAAEQGWQAVTIRRIADRIEYTSPVIYQYFSGKDALVSEVMCIGFRDITDRIEATMAEPVDSRLAALATAFWSFAFGAPELYQAMNGQAGVSFDGADMPPEVSRGFMVFHAVLESIAAEQGRRLRDPAAAVHTMWAYLHGFVALAMSGRVAGGAEQGERYMLASLQPLFDAQLA
ncbi:TetR/AcrR family transcriptional regulator [Nocardia sp. NBC_01503]|uniref:TetR/AcrR family transcriptional regulator n=1 Tax=Nocardia sp. NBC_01503 TaxID=2975997 RepID=UPI002E7B586D|nr:TetR/AcrR family transcriptional regulator [Nocardia sp. NBC_01503]WTL32591.1 TetR/AcrR family transcriptional regulator [Nocardia sp. NBC_01503]